nr:hypothetical protein RVX_2957 [Nitratidesulfovibrio sp. HK-II]
MVTACNPLRGRLREQGRGFLGDCVARPEERLQGRPVRHAMRR